MNRILFCVVVGVVLGASLAAPTIPSEIAQHATELAKSVIHLTQSAQQNPETDVFDTAMEDLVKKYIEFEQIIAKNYVDLTGKKEDSEEAFKAYYEAVDKLWHSALGDKEGKDVTVVELAAAAKHIAQQMVNLIPHLQMTPTHLDQLLAHGEVIFIIADDAHHVIHPERDHHDHDHDADAAAHKRERRWAHPQGHWPYNIFWAEHQWGPYGQHWTGPAHHGHWGHGHGHGHGWGHGWGHGHHHGYHHGW